MILGPKGRNVVLEKAYGAPLITNDGVTIAREIELEDPYENMGAQLVKEVSIKTNDIAGDGTTTATILAQAIIREGLKNVAAGANPMILQKGLRKAVEAAVASIREDSHEVATNEDIAEVAWFPESFLGQLPGGEPGEAGRARFIRLLLLFRKSRRNDRSCKANVGT